MNQDRLESLMALSVHKKELDSVDLIRVSNNFVRRNLKLRAIDFGEFSNADRFWFVIVKFAFIVKFS